MTAPQPDFERLYTPAQVARAFSVHAKTVSRWAKVGRIPADAIVFTLGGHRRMKADVIDALMRGEQP